MPSRPNIRVRREFGNEPAQLVEKVAKLQPWPIAREAAKFLYAQDVATRFANSFPGASFRGLAALSILDQGALPDLNGTTEMRAELVGQAMVGIMRAERGEKSKLVRDVASGALRNNVKFGLTTQIVTENKPLDILFGKRQGRFSAMMELESSALGVLSMTALAYPVSSFRGANLVEAAAVAGACWLDANAHNPLTRLVYDRPQRDIDEINATVEKYLNSVQRPTVGSILKDAGVEDDVNPGVRMLSNEGVYGAIRKVYDLGETLPGTEHHNRYDGPFVPTDMFFSQLSADMTRFDMAE